MSERALGFCKWANSMPNAQLKNIQSLLFEAIIIIITIIIIISMSSQIPGIRVVTFLGCSRRQCKKFRYFWWYFQTSLLVNNEPGPQSMSHLNLNVPCNRFVFLKADVWYRGPRSKLSSSKLSSSRATGHEQRSSFAGCPKCGTGMFLVFLFTKDDLPTGWHIPIYFPYFSFDYVGDW